MRQKDVQKRINHLGTIYLIAEKFSLIFMVDVIEKIREVYGDDVKCKISEQDIQSLQLVSFKYELHMSWLICLQHPLLWSVPSEVLRFQVTNVYICIN